MKSNKNSNILLVTLICSSVLCILSLVTVLILLVLTNKTIISIAVIVPTTMFITAISSWCLWIRLKVSSDCNITNVDIQSENNKVKEQCKYNIDKNKILQWIKECKDIETLDDIIKTSLYELSKLENKDDTSKSKN